MDVRRVGLVLGLYSVLLGSIGFIPLENAYSGGSQTFVVDLDGFAVEGDCDSGIASDFTSIQDAVDTANPFDTVIVCPGVYNESVVIETSNLIVEGEARPFVNGNADEAFLINADEVTLAVFDTTSGGANCITVNGNNNKIIFNNQADCADNGIAAFGDNNHIVGDGGFNCGLSGVYINGNNNIIHANGSNRHGVSGLTIVGDNNSANGSFWRNNLGSGVIINGDNNKIRSNGINDNGDKGVIVNGNGNVVGANAILGNENEGIELDGENNTVKANNLIGNGIGIFCNDCIDSIIQGNIISENDSNGLNLSLDSQDNLVKGNKINNNGGFGINDDGTDNEFGQNKCQDNGSGGSDPSGLCSPQN